MGPAGWPAEASQYNPYGMAAGLEGMSGAQQWQLQQQQLRQQQQQYGGLDAMGMSSWQQQMQGAGQVTALFAAQLPVSCQHACSTQAPTCLHFPS